MNVTKEKLETLIKELPDTVGVDEVMYRLYLLQKIEAGEAAIKEKNILSHDEAMKRLSYRIRPTCP